MLSVNKGQNRACPKQMLEGRTSTVTFQDAKSLVLVRCEMHVSQGSASCCQSEILSLLPWPDFYSLLPRLDIFAHLSLLLSWASCIVLLQLIFRPRTYNTLAWNVIWKTTNNISKFWQGRKLTDTPYKESPCQWLGHFHLTELGTCHQLLVAAPPWQGHFSRQKILPQRLSVPRKSPLGSPFVLPSQKKCLSHLLDLKYNTLYNNANHDHQSIGKYLWCCMSY